MDLDGGSGPFQIPNSIESCQMLMALKFGGPGLSGTIPREIGRLQQLRSFSIFQSKIYGTIPSEVTNLPHLKSLAIQSNPNLQGTIPSNIGECSRQCTMCVRV